MILKSSETKRYPAGRNKIVHSLKCLMEKSEFNTITIAQIARTAGVTEGLIYKYFTDKRDLLHEVLREYLEFFVSQMRTEISTCTTAMTKLRKLIYLHFEVYSTNRVFAKMLLLEVRCSPGYFQSATYQVIKEYSQILLNIIEEGAKEGEIRNDVSPSVIRQFILGSIEHTVLPMIIFDRPIFQKPLADEVFVLISTGIIGNSKSPKSNQ